jgi:hypothetical protein
MPLIPKRNVTKDSFIRLGWKILYHKCLYYEFVGIKKFDYLRITDDEFDSLTKQYLNLAKIHNLKPTAHEQVGFNSRSPSGSLVLAKILVDEYKHRKRRSANTK